MVDSILTSIKQLIGIEADDDSFDFDIVTHINSALAVLTDLGVGPDTGFVILNDTPKWSDFLPENSVIRKETVVQYVYMKVKLGFDPPATGHAIAALQELVKEQEYRLNVRRENVTWTDPSLLP